MNALTDLAHELSMPMEDAPALPVKPLLRGWSHVVALVCVAVLGAALIVKAGDSDRGSGLMWVYVLGTASMFGVSAAYHRMRWRPRTRAIMSKLDHSTIFLAIAGAYTPVAVLGLDGVHRVVVLSISWIGAVIGISLQWLPFHLPRWMFAAVYVLVGWSALFAFPQLYSGLGIGGFLLILFGGLAYTIGALVYAMKRPDPWPRVFGFHEVFHAFTIVGASLHFAAISFWVLPKF